SRPSVPEPLTDVLLERCDQNVARRLAENPGARFSSTGFARLLQHAEHDCVIADAIRVRSDVAPALVSDSGNPEQVDGRGPDMRTERDSATVPSAIAALHREGRL